MPRQIPIATVMNTFNFMPSKGKFIFNINRSFCVMGKFIGRMRTKTKIFFFYSPCQIPFHAFFFPILKKARRFIRMNKMLLLHLFKFTHPIRKMPWCYFITKCLTNLPNTKWQRSTHRRFHICIIYVNSLCRFTA